MPAAGPTAKQQWRVSLNSGTRGGGFRLTVKASSTLRLLGSGAAKISVHLRLGRFFALLNYSEASSNGAPTPCQRRAATLKQKLLKAFRTAFRRAPRPRFWATESRGSIRRETGRGPDRKNQMLRTERIASRGSSLLSMPLCGVAASWARACCSYLLVLMLRNLSGGRMRRLAAAIAAISAVSALVAIALKFWNSLSTGTQRGAWHSGGWSDLPCFPSWDEILYR